MSAEDPRAACDLLLVGGLVLTLDAADRIIPDGAIAVAADRIVDIGPRAGDRAALARARPERMLCLQTDYRLSAESFTHRYTNHFSRRPAFRRPSTECSLSSSYLHTAAKRLCSSSVNFGSIRNAAASSV